MSIRAITAPELAYLRDDQQWSRLFLAGTENPPVIFACQVNQTFSTHDKVAQIAFDNVTAGAYTDVLPGMTVWVGSTAGAWDVGMARVRKSATSALLYIGEESEVKMQDNHYLTVVDEMGLWVKHPNGIKLDYDVVYANQHTVFDPIVIMGANVVKDVVEYPVTVTFPDAINSSVYGSTISTWAWTANAGVMTDETTSAPTLTINAYPASGLIRVALTLTSAAGKSFTGYRYVRVYDADHRPVTEFNLDSCDATVDSGGFGFTVTLYGEAAKTLIRDRAPVTVYAADYYGGTQVSLGQAAGRENIVCTGWVVGESIDYDPIAGSASFTVQGAHYWMDKSTAYPSYLEIARKTPVKWVIMPGLTVDRALWHLCHWRSTISAMMDVTYVSDARLTVKSETVVSSLWEQFKKISKRIFAAPFVDQYGRLSINVSPQMTPEIDRDWAALQEITKSDWLDSITITRRVLTESAMVSLTGKKSSASGGSVSYYSLSNGHVYKRFGTAEMIDDVIVDSQTQSNELAGLYAGWKNNELPTINIKLAANNRLITLMPNQFLNITIDAADNERGIAYAGNLILKGVSFVWDAENYILLTDISCEAETFAEPAINGDIPLDNSGVGMSTPPIDVSMPEMPALPALALTAATANANHPKKVVVTSSTHGVLFCVNFNETEPEWKTMNEGLTEAEYKSIGNIVKTPGGALFCMCGGGETAGYTAIYYAPRIGAVWQRLLTEDDNDIHFQALGNDKFSERAAVIGGYNYDEGTPGGHGRFYYATSGGLGAKLESGIPLKTFYLHSIIQIGGGGWCFVGTSVEGFAGSNIQSFIQLFNASGAAGAFYNKDNSGMYGNGGASLIWGAAAIGSQDAIYLYKTNDTGYGKMTSLGIFDAYNIDAIRPGSFQALAPSPVGQRIMAADYNGGFFSAYRSPNGGASWELMTGVIPLGMSTFENCGDNNRWIFGGGVSLKLTVSFGDLDPSGGTDYYFNKEGNLAYVAPLININRIRFIA